MDRQEQINDIAFHALRRSEKPDLDKAPFSSALGSTTIHILLRDFCRFVRRDSSGFHFSMRRQNDEVAIVIEADPSSRETAFTTATGP